MEGGRLFVDYEGAYWKRGSTGSIEKIRFVSWSWKGDPPERAEIPRMSYKELLAIAANNRNARGSRKKT
jgi:hypothetical protein